MRVPCPGPLRRREFLRAGVLGLGGLSLGNLMQARAAQPAAQRDTSIILFWMWGGPSQLETYDLKPDAPSEYRGPFRPIPTNVPGLDICELFPQQARLADKFSLVRSLHHEMSAHNDGSIEVLTGKTPRLPDPTSTSRSEHPDFGMVAARCRGSRADGLPNYVGIPRQPFMTQPNYLGVSQSAFATGDPAVDKFRAPNLELAAGLDARRLDDRSGLVSQFDRFRRGLDLHGSLAGTEDFRAGALRVLTSQQVSAAFDLGREEPRLRDRYGRHLWGQSFLLARRLAEAGTAVVTIDALAPTLSDRYFSWDDHINPQTRWDMADAMRYRAPFMDQGLSALIEDLHERGLDRRILVVAMGEFGRTPRLEHKDGKIGRDHYPGAMSILVAGGGVPTGQVIGATSNFGAHPIDRKLDPHDILATVYKHLGIDHRREYLDPQGRPFPLTHGTPIKELVG